jgi:hypothetical protein
MIKSLIPLEKFEFSLQKIARRKFKIECKRNKQRKEEKGRPKLTVRIEFVEIVHSTTCWDGIA